MNTCLQRSCRERGCGEIYKIDTGHDKQKESQKAQQVNPALVSFYNHVEVFQFIGIQVGFLCL